MSMNVVAFMDMNVRSFSFHECTGARDIHDMDINVTFLLSSYMPMNDVAFMDMNVWVTKTSKSE